MGYRPGPVRRVLLPKDGSPGATRPLGISTVEDKLVHGMMQQVLEAIDEPLFRDCASGFRPGRGAQDAVRALHPQRYRHEVQSVMAVELAQFFDSIDHRVLLERGSEKVCEQRFLRYLGRLLQAGVLVDGELRSSEEGTPQGSRCSPVLANIVAHGVMMCGLRTRSSGTVQDEWSGSGLRMIGSSVARRRVILSAFVGP